MDLIFLEIILWAALVFFFWALRENLGNVEAELLEAQALKQREIAVRALQRRFVQPDQIGETIGYYRDAPIHASIWLHGDEYQFDYACPPESAPVLRLDQCYVAPGIVYVRADSASAAAASGAASTPCQEAPYHSRS